MKRGYDHNMGLALGHDPETIELLFENRLTLAIDPSRVTWGRFTDFDTGAKSLQFGMSRVNVLMTRDDDLLGLND